MKHIEAKGLACPQPVILAKKAIADGETAFTISVDNAAAVENLTRLADSQGYTAATTGADGGFTLTLTGSGASVPAAEVPAAPAAGPWAVFVGRDIIGAGDRELGTSLMRMFFYTLTQSEDLPGAILFMNDGVRLPALDEQVAEHLNTLQGRGVDVLVCGTCLNFYHLADGLKTGTVSNMLDIVTRMQTASKVISL